MSASNSFLPLFRLRGSLHLQNYCKSVRGEHKNIFSRVSEFLWGFSQLMTFIFQLIFLNLKKFNRYRILHQSSGDHSEAM